jgi:hypothetical protein
MGQQSATLGHSSRQNYGDRAAVPLMRRYSDFTPSLTRDDVYGILHATTNADDQKAINALIEREDQMERERGTPSSIGESNRTATESGRQ